MLERHCSRCVAVLFSFAASHLVCCNVCAYREPMSADLALVASSSAMSMTDNAATLLWPKLGARLATCSDETEGAAPAAEACSDESGAEAAAEAQSAETETEGAAVGAPPKRKPVATSLPLVTLALNERWRMHGEVTLPAYLQEELTPELEYHYQQVRNKALYQTVKVSVCPGILKASRTGDPGSDKIYFALDIAWHKTGMIPPPINPHISLFYESQFADWAHFHAAVNATAGLLATRLVDAYLTPYGKSHFEVDENCSLHALCRQVKWMLSRYMSHGIDIPENEFSRPMVDFHITWL